MAIPYTKKMIKRDSRIFTKAEKGWTQIDIANSENLSKARIVQILGDPKTHRKRLRKLAA